MGVKQTVLAQTVDSSISTVLSALADGNTKAKKADK